MFLSDGKLYMSQSAPNIHMATDGSGDRDSVEIDLSVPSDRRKFLGALGAAGAAGLAGCSGGGSNDDGEGDNTDTSDGTDSGTGGESGVLDQSLKTFVASSTASEQEPKALTDWGWAPSNYRTQYPRGMYPFLFGRKMNVLQGTAEEVPMLIDEWEHTDEEIHYHIREDATWSDGSDITAGALLGGGWPVHKATHAKPASELDEFSTWDEAITGFEADGKDFYIRSDVGGFSEFWMEPIVTDWINHAGSAEFTTDAAWGQFLRDQVNDEFDTLWDNPEASQFATDLSNETIENSEHWPDTPQELKFSGAFKISEILEAEVHLERNENWVHADAINWDQVTLIRQNNSQAQNALVKNSQVSMVTNHTPSEQVVDSFPDSMQNFPYGYGDTTNLLCQGQHPHLGKPEVRKAMLQAINAEQLLQISNQYTTGPLNEPPGLHAQREQQFMDDDLREQYVDYSYDLDAANQRMRDAGYTKENGTWVSPEGDKVTAELMTSADELQMEQALSQQLSNFGIDTSPRSVTDTQFGSRLDNANFDIAIRPWGTGDAVWGPAVLGAYYRAFQQSDRRIPWGLFDEDEVQAFIDRHDEVTNKEYDWTNNIEGIWPNPDLVNPEVQDEWVPSIEAPPVGQPDSDETVEYPVVYWGLIWGQNLSQEKRNEIIQGVTWVWNQTLKPFVPFLVSNNLAFNDVNDWNVPEKDSKWWQQAQPQHKLIEQSQNTYEASGN